MKIWRNLKFEDFKNIPFFLYSKYILLNTFNNDINLNKFDSFLFLDWLINILIFVNSIPINIGYIVTINHSTYNFILGYQPIYNLSAFDLNKNLPSILNNFPPNQILNNFKFLKEHNYVLKEYIHFNSHKPNTTNQS